MIVFMFCGVAIVVVIVGIGNLYSMFVGQIMWCEKCNTWQKMILQTGQINGWVCPKCNWLNQRGHMLGTCPTCGWYQKYESRTVSHRGPFRKVERKDINLFYGIQTEYWVYEEKINCPKHGVFTALIPVNVYQNSQANSQDDYEEDDYDDYDYDDYDSREDDYYDSEAENRGLY